MSCFYNDDIVTSEIRSFKLELEINEISKEIKIMGVSEVNCKVVAVGSTEKLTDNQ